MGINHSVFRVPLSGVAALFVAASLSFTVRADITNTIVGTDSNALFEVNENISSILSENRGSNGGGDQSQQGSDVLSGTTSGDLMIGALDIDVMFGENGDDILIGGTKDFNPFNRDRAFRGKGNDVFLNVSPPAVSGSQDFDGIFIFFSSNLPAIAKDRGPGFVRSWLVPQALRRATNWQRWSLITLSGLCLGGQPAMQERELTMTGYG